MTFASSGKTQVSIPIPKSLPSGEYLLRVEHIGLHSAGSSGGAQFYISCAQIKVENGGSGSPSPLVAFPGAYKATDPGILINIYYPVPTSYTPPGAAVGCGERRVLSGGGGGMMGAVLQGPFWPLSK
jgi:hypothetical protein